MFCRRPGGGGKFADMRGHADTGLGGLEGYCAFRHRLVQVLRQSPLYVRARTGQVFDVWKLAILGICPSTMVLPTMPSELYAASERLHVPVGLQKFPPVRMPLSNS